MGGEAFMEKLSAKGYRALCGNTNYWAKSFRNEVGELETRLFKRMANGEFKEFNRRAGEYSTNWTYKSDFATQTRDYARNGNAVDIGRTFFKGGHHQKSHISLKPGTGEVESIRIEYPNSEVHNYDFSKGKRTDYAMGYSGFPSPGSLYESWSGEAPERFNIRGITQKYYLA